MRNCFIEKLLERFAGRIADAADFTRRYRVMLLRSKSGVGIDLTLGALPYEELVVSRATLFEFPRKLSFGPVPQKT
jgi:hypothetical protein